MLTIKEANVQPVYDLIAILEDAKKGYFSASEKIRDEVFHFYLKNSAIREVSIAVS